MTAKSRLLWLTIAILPTLAYVLHDFVFQFPDNQGDVTLGLMLTLVGLVVAWAGSGYLIARHARGAASSIARGAFAGLVSVAMLWLTFVVLNQWFIDRMSYEPNRILAFQRSGYKTMREYWSQQRGWGPFPLALAIAMIVGAIGGALRRVTNRPTL